MNDPDAPSALTPRRRCQEPDRGLGVQLAGRQPARYRYADTVIYEVHVKGFTMRHPDIPPELRGTYAGLGHDAAIAHLKDLGVTTVELLPVHQNVPEWFLVGRGLTNYWGYNTIGFLRRTTAIPPPCARGGRRQVTEFQAMVDALHRAGLEVLLDVVFNHTAEAGPDGPDAVLPRHRQRGLLRWRPATRAAHDTTGSGNSLNVGDPITLRLIMDSLLLRPTEMHVDGFGSTWRRPSPGRKAASTRSPPSSTLWPRTR